MECLWEFKSLETNLMTIGFENAKWLINKVKRCIKKNSFHWNFFGDFIFNRRNHYFNSFTYDRFLDILPVKIIMGLAIGMMLVEVCENLDISLVANI